MAQTSGTFRPTSNEEEYFARENAERQRRLADELRKRLDADEREALRQLHWMRCPKCGSELQAVRHRQIEVDTCFACGGIFLDQGELEQLTAPSKAGFLDDVIGWFRGARDAR